MGANAAAVLHALAALERAHDGPLPPQAWQSLRHGSQAARLAVQSADAAALQRERAWRLLGSAGRWRRRQAPDRAADNLAAAREALLGWRRLAFVNCAGPCVRRE
ncbi:MAG TPA: hypothetical protein VGO34_00590 [Alphaproteobacteria bacterium]